MNRRLRTMGGSFGLRASAAGAVAALTLLVPAVAAAAQRYRSGQYTGKTSQGLRIKVYVGQAVAGELGRDVIYKLSGRRLKLREMTTVTMRVRCTNGSGARFTENTLIHIVGNPQHRFSASDPTIRNGAFRYSVDSLEPLNDFGSSVLNEFVSGHVSRSSASGVVRLRVIKFGSDINGGEVKLATCVSGDVSWKARRTGRGTRGRPVIRATPARPRRIQLDSALRRVIRSDGSAGTALFRDEGAGSFTAYLFKADGTLNYCRRTGGVRDYRSGTWKVLAGYMTFGREGMDGTLKFALDGSAPANGEISLSRNNKGTTASLTFKDPQFPGGDYGYDFLRGDCAEYEPSGEGGLPFP